MRGVDQSAGRSTGGIERLVQRRRDHGMVLFIDLRDRTGLTQVVFNAERNAAVHQAAHTLRSECVVSVTGQVMARPEESSQPASADGRD